MSLLRLQKLNEVIFRLQPEFTLNVRVIVGVPLELLNEMAWPAEPAKLVQTPLLLVQLDMDKLESKVPGATV